MTNVFSFIDPFRSEMTMLVEDGHINIAEAIRLARVFSVSTNQAGSYCSFWIDVGSGSHLSKRPLKSQSFP